MTTPSKIQAMSIPSINASQSENFLFQATNGSGKTLAFGIPAIMRVDASDPRPQVIIMANTRELIRQVAGVLQAACKKCNVTICIGEKEAKAPFAQIIVSVPAWIANMSGGR
jgi:superfamily II DNA/RNA helicase